MSGAEREREISPPPPTHTHMLVNFTRHGCKTDPFPSSLPDLPGSFLFYMRTVEEVPPAFGVKDVRKKKSKLPKATDQRPQFILRRQTIF